MFGAVMDRQWLTATTPIFRSSQNPYISFGFVRNCFPKHQTMSRPDLSRVPAYFHTYTNQVLEDDLMEAFRNQEVNLFNFLQSLPVEKRTYSYAPGKWTIIEVLQHLIDAERVFAYRALCFSRGDQTPLPSFDENNYAIHSKANKRNWDQLIEEFKHIRKGNELMFEAFDEQQLDAAGTASNNPLYVLGVGFIMVGHVNHHIRITRERYL